MISPSLVQAWFDSICRQVQGVVQGCVYLGAADSDHYQLQVRSETFNETELIQENIQAVLKRRKSIVTRSRANTQARSQDQRMAVNDNQAITHFATRNYLVSCPILINKQLYGAVCIELDQERSLASQDFLFAIETAVKWLQFIVQSKNAESDVPQHAALALKITGLALSQESSIAAAIAVVTELANKLSCERVSIGFVHGQELQLFALSHSARYEAKQNLIKRMESAMQEAIDQRETLVYPAPPDSHNLLKAQANLARNHATDYICSIPIVHNDEIIGGITYERNNSAEAFTQESVELCEQLTALCAPILEYRRLNERSLLVKANESLRTVLLKLAGRGHLSAKFSLLVGTVIFLLLFIVQGEYRISANAVLEGTIERVITAPEAGYVKDAKARPGDIVIDSQILATLDDRDLKLEKLKWIGKHKQVAKEYREALANHVRSQIGILRAQLDQAEAQIEILDKKLERTIIRSPIPGIIVSGDFTRALGSPVERGQILYKVSPLDEYRVLLNINETDVAQLSEGMRGELTLSASAKETFSIVVEKITPVSIAGDGSNYFQVEAALEETPDFLRPGMQGIGKIDIGKRQILWIWTHEFVDWMRLKLWAWW